MPSLRLEELFSQPWAGDGTVRPPWWLRWLPTPRTFAFRTEITACRDDAWSVLDTTTFPGGIRRERRMCARRTGPDRVLVTADDMPGGAEVRERDDGFDFSPYVLRTQVLGPLRVPLRCRDSVRLVADGTLVDTIELRLWRIFVGRVVMQLRPEPGPVAQHAASAPE